MPITSFGLRGGERICLHLLPWNAAAGPQTRPRPRNSREEARVVLQPEVEPIVLSRKTDEHSGGPAVTRDNDLLFGRVVQIL